jgi:two-component system, OmpR family, phosphate regulon sensor histidine kinase PhoR
MAARKLIWQLFPSYLLIIFVTIFVILFYTTGAVRSFFMAETARELQDRATLIGDQLIGAPNFSHADFVDSLCKKLGRDSQTRVTVVSISGAVIGDSDFDPSNMENHANREEIQKALTGGVGVTTRYSHTLFKTMMYVAVPLKANGNTIGAVRAAFPLTKMDETLGQLRQKIIWAGVVAILISGLISLYISRRISRPLVAMKQVAHSFSQGNLEQRLPIWNSEEIGELAVAMNQMASQLDEKIRTIVSQRNEQEAILSSMIEGVLAIDNNERLLNCNRTAAEMVGFEREQAIGKYIQEAIRNVSLQKFVSQALASSEPLEDEIMMESGRDRIFQAHGTSLKASDGNTLGALVVLNDITRLRQLEGIRRDFVANVSHELKTPITSIKGFVETLQSGAIENAADSERFLGIVARQVDRLNSIIDDLLALSKIEQNVERAEINLMPGKINLVLSSAIAACRKKADEKSISLSLDCANDIVANINDLLLEQAVVNLIDNAIKYSSSGGSIDVACGQINGIISILVRDNGCGIEKIHLPRLFERFYRVDKARSRSQGGTGLGLAIVKHIVLAHGGKVVVESTPGKGSLFTITLPQMR